MGNEEKVYKGAITLFYKRVGNETRYLVVENAKTGNVTFVSGAEEDRDVSLIATATREIKEELGIEAREYALTPTTVWHNFIFDEKKKERAGHKGSYQVFVADLTNFAGNIAHTAELKQIKWMPAQEVLEALAFPDLKQIFVTASSKL